LQAIAFKEHQVLCKLTDQIISSLIADADLSLFLRMLIYQLFCFC
jgi:hypothetical protein